MGMAAILTQVSCVVALSQVTQYQEEVKKHVLNQVIVSPLLSPLETAIEQAGWIDASS